MVLKTGEHKALRPMECSGFLDCHSVHGSPGLQSCTHSHQHWRDCSKFVCPLLCKALISSDKELDFIPCPIHWNQIICPFVLSCRFHFSTFSSVCMWQSITLNSDLGHWLCVFQCSCFLSLLTPNHYFIWIIDIIFLWPISVGSSLFNQTYLSDLLILGRSKKISCNIFSFQSLLHTLAWQMLFPYLF